MEQFRSAMSMLNGRLLEGIHEGWADSARQNFYDRLTSAVLELNRDLADRRGRGAGVPFLRLVLNHVPEAEALHITLIRELTESRRFEEAIVAFETYRALVEDELGGEIDFETGKLLAYAESGRRVQQRRVTKLPVARAALIGRDKEVQILRNLVSGEGSSPIVNVLGVGGLGKTRLASAVASLEFADGRDVLWIDMSDRSEPHELLAELLRAQESASGSATIETIAALLDGRQALLILDNMETAAASCGENVSVLVARTPDLRVLITSRLPLGCANETIFHLRPLPTNAECSDDFRSPAVDLFVAQANRVRTTPFTEADLHYASALCTRLSGIPLAIELAATYANLFPPAQILKNMTSLLKSEDFRVDGEDHRSTLRGALSWSYQQLSPSLQRTYRRLAVFHGPFSLNAAAHVTSSPNTIDELHALISVALIVSEDSGVEGTYHLLQPLSEFLKSTWSDEEREELPSRHSDYYFNLVVKLSSVINGPDCIGAYDQLDSEFTNLITAIDWISSDNPAKALDILSGLTLYWIHRRHSVEALHRIERLLDRVPCDRSLSYGNGVAGAAHLAWYANKRDAMHGYGHEAWKTFREIGAWTQAAHLFRLPYLVDCDIAPLQSFDPISEAGRISDFAKESGDLAAQIAADTFRFVLTARGGNLPKAIAQAQETLRLCKSHGCPWQTAEVLEEYGYLLLQVCKYQESFTRFVSAQELRREISGDLSRPFRAIVCLPLIAMGRYEEARKVIEASFQITHKIGPSLELADEYLYLSYVQSRVGETDGARDSLLKALEIKSEHGSPADRAVVEANLASLAHLVGDVPAARYWVLRSEEDFASFQFHKWSTVGTLASARLMVDANEFARALDTLRVTAEHLWYEQNWVKLADVLGIRAIVGAAAGRSSDATRAYLLAEEVRTALLFVQHPLERAWERRLLGLDVSQITPFQLRPWREIEADVQEQLAQST